MLTKISSKLDAIADCLEKKGLTKEAFEVDKVADEIDRISSEMFVIKNSEGWNLHFDQKAPHKLRFAPNQFPSVFFSRADAEKKLEEIEKYPEFKFKPFRIVPQQSTTARGDEE